MTNNLIDRVKLNTEIRGAEPVVQDYEKLIEDIKMMKLRIFNESFPQRKVVFNQQLAVLEQAANQLHTLVDLNAVRTNIPLRFAGIGITNYCPVYPIRYTTDGVPIHDPSPWDIAKSNVWYAGGISDSIMFFKREPVSNTIVRYRSLFIGDFPMRAKEKYEALLSAGFAETGIIVASSNKEMFKLDEIPQPVRRVDPVLMTFIDDKSYVVDIWGLDKEDF